MQDQPLSDETDKALFKERPVTAAMLNLLQTEVCAKNDLQARYVLAGRLLEEGTHEQPRQLSSSSAQGGGQGVQATPMPRVPRQIHLLGYSQETLDSGARRSPFHMQNLLFEFQVSVSHLNRDKIKSNLSIPGILGCHENSLC